MPVSELAQAFKLMAIIGKALEMTCGSGQEASRLLLALSRIAALLTPGSIVVARAILSCSWSGFHNRAVRVTR